MSIPFTHHSRHSFSKNFACPALGTCVISNVKPGYWKLESWKRLRVWISNEVLDIRGTYSLKKDTVYVRPLAITKQIGGKLSKNLYTTINDSWEITDGVIKTVKLPHGPQYSLIIKVISSRKILEIDGSLYYKI